jgi:hypothetical protein
MTKLIFILVLIFCLQNPLPAWGIGESDLPHQEVKSERGPASPDIAFFRKGMFFADCYYGHYRHRCPYDGADGSQEGSSADGWTAVWTLLLVIVGVTQCVLFFYQWRMMRKAVYQSQAALDHATESSERGLRAYVTVDLPNTEKKEDDFGLPSRYSISIKNCGQTPAYDVITRIKWCYSEGVNSKWPVEVEPIDDRYTLNATEIGSITTLGNGQEIFPEFALDEPAPDGKAFSEIYARFKNKEVTIFFQGLIRYKDIFGKVRNTWFCDATGELNSTGHFTIFAYNKHSGAD